MAPPDAEKQPRPSLKSLLSHALSWDQLYVLSAAVLVLASSRLFYSSLKLQTEHAALWFAPEHFRAFVEGAQAVPWSAPLDDVFIHFDFARATARGYPFEWIEGNGYSSGGTSLLYPFVLALGFLVGFTGLHLFHWAALVAMVGTFATLLGARRMFKHLPPVFALIAPPAMLAVGALNWTLYSGMEVAVFLALWALALVVWDDLLEAIHAGTATRLQAVTLGLACALLVSGRPEASPIVAIFGIWCAIAWWKRGRIAASLSTLVLVGAPGALVVIAHMLANKVLTGSSSAAGALAKLEMHHPYLTGDQVFDSWVFFLRYQFLRLSDYHFSALSWGYASTGYLVWPIALLSVVFKKTRRYGAVLLMSVVIWFSLVALNGQVRWQNERYTMPAVAWVLLAAALGLGASLDWALQKERRWLARSTTVVPLLAAVVLFLVGQAPRYRDQVWFFGRASRNILEQHVRAAAYLKEVKPARKRVLLSDAGAIPYISDLPAFDLIGLGGYGRLPIAGASRQGVGAAVELIEYMPRGDRPDVMALYPSWWSDFVLWFGHRVNEFPVRGNVICGGASKVIYAPRWAPIDRSGQPITSGGDLRLIDAVDVADVISEKAHRVTWNREAQGYVTMKILPETPVSRRDLWDAGRLLSTHMELNFQMTGFDGSAATLLVRVAPAQPASFELLEGSQVLDSIQVEASDNWQEIAIPLKGMNGTKNLTLKPSKGELHVFHIFAVSGSPSETRPSASSPGETETKGK